MIPLSPVAVKLSAARLAGLGFHEFLERINVTPGVADASPQKSGRWRVMSQHPRIVASKLKHSVRLTSTDFCTSRRNAAAASTLNSVHALIHAS